MQIPSPYIPSPVSQTLTYSIEGKLRVEDRLNNGRWPGMGAANSMNPTEAERFDSMAPFLKAAKIKDAPRRNYIIQPGGSVVYFDNPQSMKELIYDTPSTAHIPTDQESFAKGLSTRIPMATGTTRGGTRLCRPSLPRGSSNPTRSRTAVNRALKNCPRIHRHKGGKLGRPAR